MRKIITHKINNTTGEIKTTVMDRRDVSCVYLYGIDNDFSVCTNCPDKCNECKENSSAENGVKSYFIWRWKQWK